MTPWFLARAAGLTAYAAFAISTILGLLLSTKFLGRKPTRSLMIWHEAFSISGFLLIGLHAWAILNDQFFKFTWKALLIPGLSPYAPFAVALGVGAAYLAAITIASFYLRKKIGPRNWRRLHYATPLLFGAMTAHGLMAGSDATNPAVLGMYSVSVAIVIVLLVYRVFTAARKPSKEARARRLGPAVTQH